MVVFSYFIYKVVSLGFYGGRQPAFCLCKIMMLSLPVVDGLDFQLVAIAQELLILFGGAFHRQQSVGRGQKGDWVMVQLFILLELLVTQTHKILTVKSANKKRTGKIIGGT